MDKLKDLAGKASGSSSGGGEQKPAAGGQEDYLDKGMFPSLGYTIDVVHERIGG